MKHNTQGMLEMSGAMLISGTIGWFVIAADRPVMDIVFWRCAFGAATLLVICAARGFLRRDVMTHRQLGVAALGGVAIVLNWLLLFASYSHSSISIATVVYNTQPFMLTALGAVFLKERIAPHKLAWLGAAFLGMVLIVSGKPHASYVGTSHVAGVGLALAAAACYATAAILAKALRGVPPHLIALIHVVVGVAMLAPFASLTLLPVGVGAWAPLLTLGVLHTGVMYILLYGAFQKLPTNVIGALSFIYPIAAIVVDMTAFGHRMQIGQLIGAAAILIGAAGATLGWKLSAPSDAGRSRTVMNER